MWPDAGTQRPELTLHSHSDYVTCLATASHGPQFVSGGLRGQVFLWDLNHPEPTEQARALHLPTTLFQERLARPLANHTITALVRTAVKSTCAMHNLGAAHFGTSAGVHLLCC